MAETFFNAERFKSFGLNVRAHEKTLNLVGETFSKNAGGAVSPLFQYLEENDNVFTGNVAHEVMKLNVASFNIGAMMQQEDLKVNGKAPQFDSKF